jgi:polyisoprenyl-teichoic acid--peptidoglycan teichoic acid transferase
MLLVIGVGAYGMYDLVMAPQASLTQHGKANDGKPRRGTAGLLGSVFGGAGVELCPGQKQVNVLVLGTDERREGGRADTIMLVMIRKDTHRAAAVSLPRDLMVHMEGHGTQKINAVYALNKSRGTGEIMTGEAVSGILGVPVDFYVKTDVTKFPKLFDAFGGLDVYVDRDMEYDDSWGGLHIHLKQGMQHLDGEGIEGFVRHRHDKHGRASTDYERNQRQQYVLKELARQKGNFASAARLPQIASALQEMIRTDMTLPELVALGMLARQVDTTQVISRMVPTRAYRGAAWYAVLDPDATRELMAQVEQSLLGGVIPQDTSPERNDRIGQGTLTPDVPPGNDTATAAPGAQDGTTSAP